MDFFIVITSSIELSMSNSHLQSLRAIRLLRALRPLRVISYNNQLKIVINALFKSIKGIFNTCVILMIVTYIESIIAV